MKKRIGVLGIVMFVLILFVLAGFPLLRYAKDHVESLDEDPNLFENATQGISNKRTIDLSVEPVCMNPVTKEVDLVCQTRDGCDSMCRIRGCSDFDMYYYGTDFSEQKCKCICTAKNLIERGLDPETEDDY